MNAGRKESISLIEDDIYNGILTAYEETGKLDSEAYDLLIRLMKRISAIYDIDPTAKDVLRNAIILIVNLFFDNRMEFEVLNKKEVKKEDLEKIKQTLLSLVQA
jgi:hypothetical protein